MENRMRSLKVAKMFLAKRKGHQTKGLAMSTGEYLFYGSTVIAEWSKGSVVCTPYNEMPSGVPYQVLMMQSVVSIGYKKGL